MEIGKHVLPECWSVGVGVGAHHLVEEVDLVLHCGVLLFC